ncbi:unnamed protein product [Rhizophagus irregularis]|nr:unnamed protein product [Rhizophagus irregularis]
MDGSLLERITHQNSYIQTKHFQKKKKENVKVWVTLPSPSRKPRKHRISLRYTPITLIPKVKEKSLSDTWKKRNGPFT